MQRRFCRQHTPIAVRCRTDLPQRSEAILNKRIFRLVAALLALSLLCACGQSTQPSKEKTENFTPYSIPAFADSVFQADQATAAGCAQVDLSQLDSGIVGVKAQSDIKLKFQIVQGEQKYNYDLPGNGTPTFYPLNMGSGSYTFRLMEQVEENKYTCSWSQECAVSLLDEFQPFLRPSQLVDYSENSACVQEARELAADCSEDSEVAAAVYDLLVNNIRYDKQKAETVQSGYLPDPDETLSSKKGICFDYAALAAAMLRSMGIPCKLITGYVGENTYHAWNSFYLKNSGWITVEFKVNANEWQRVDITFAAGGGLPDAGSKSGIQYTTRYTY